jgi:acyl carrier protein
MMLEEVIAEVNAIFLDVLDDESIVLKETTTAQDVAAWDSLAHIQLVVAIEKHFKIRFTAAEIRSFKNVGEMCQSILAKVQRA